MAGDVSCSLITCLMNGMLFSITSRLKPCSSGPVSKAGHEGSTFLDVKPRSASNPTCETCMNEPAFGPDIVDLSILPP